MKYDLNQLLKHDSASADPESSELPRPLIQAWGLSRDSKGHLYITDGSDQIHVVDPHKWRVVNSIKVKNEDGSEELSNLNELEVVSDKWAFANQYTENELLQISLESGRVLRRWDLSAL